MTSSQSTLTVAPAARRRRRSVSVAIAVVIAAYVSGPLSNDLILPVMPFLMAEFAVSESATQTVLSMLMLGTGLGCVVLGPLSDSYGRVRVLVLSFLAYAAAGLACRFASDIESLAALRFLQGFAGASAPVVGLAVINDMLGRTQAAAANSRAIAAMAFCGALIPLLSTVLTDLFGWKSVWIGTAVYGLAVAAACCWLLPETNPSRSRSRLRPARLLSSYLGMLGSPLFMLYATASSFSFAALLSYIGPHSFIVLNTLEMPHHLFMLLFAPLPVGVFVGARTAIVFLRRCSVEQTMLIGCSVQSCAAGAMLALGLLTEPALAPLLASLAVLAVGAGIVMPSSQVACVKVFPTQAGAAGALARTASMVAAAVAMQLALIGFDGWLASPAAVMTLCSALALLATAASMRLLRMQHRASQRLQESDQCNIIGCSP